MATQTRTNEERFRRTVEALNDRDERAFVETHAEDVVVHDHDDEFHGVEGAVEQEWSLFEAFPDMEYAVEEVVAEGDTVAARWRVTGTHEGEFAGVPPTGEAIDIPASGVFRVEDDAIAEVWLTYDRLGMLRQLGVVDPPEE